MTNSDNKDQSWD